MGQQTEHRPRKGYDIHLSLAPQCTTAKSRKHEIIHAEPFVLSYDPFSRDHHNHRPWIQMTFQPTVLPHLNQSTNYTDHGHHQSTFHNNTATTPSKASPCLHQPTNHRSRIRTPSSPFQPFTFAMSANYRPWLNRHQGTIADHG